MTLFQLSDAELDRWLAEDAPFGDLTTHALGIGDRPARITFTARQAGIAACTEEAARLLERCGARVLRTACSGTPIAPGGELLAAEGAAGALHLGWKPAQTVMEYALAIATTTRAIRDAARAVNPRTAVACTRKNIPCTRAMAVKSVLAGGGVPHRLGLSDTVLVFAQHRALVGDDPVPALIDLARRVPERLVTVEVDSVAEAAELLTPLHRAGVLPGVVQLDKGGPDGVAALRRLLDDLVRPTTVAGVATPRPVLAAAGGITPTNAAAHTAAGADVLVTSAPYAAPPLDVAVRIEPAG